mgnify:CR=1 FL=1
MLFLHFPCMHGGTFGGMRSWYCYGGLLLLVLLPNSSALGSWKGHYTDPGGISITITLSGDSNDPTLMLNAESSAWHLKVAHTQPSSH